MRKKTKMGDEVGKTSRAGRHDWGEGHREAAGEIVLWGNPRVGNGLDFHLGPYVGLYTIRPRGGHILFQCAARPSLRPMFSECMECMHPSKFLILFSLFLSVVMGKAFGWTSCHYPALGPGREVGRAVWERHNMKSVVG